MRNFGFSKKIYFGFGLLILAIGIVGLFGSQSVKGVSGLFSDFRQAASQNLLLASIQEDLMAVRLNEFKYRVAADLEAANGVRDGIAQIADEQERIEEIVSDPALRQILEQITNTLIQYEETFSSVEALEFSRSRGLKAISDATEEIAEIMRAIGDSDVAESMAVVDAAIVRFDQDRQATDLEAAIGRIDTAISTVDNMLILLADATRRGQAEATVESLGSLKEKISALDAILVERDQLYNQIDILGPATARLLDDGLQASFESQKRSGDEATGKIETTTQLLQGGVLIAVLVGLVLSILIARPASRALHSLTQSMRAIAGGDLLQEVPGKDRGDELGEMAHAVDVFREAGIENEQLRTERAKSEEASREKRTAEMQHLASTFEKSVGGIVESLKGSASRMKDVAKDSSIVARDTSTKSTSVAAASEQASLNVQTVASATEEMTRSLEAVGELVSKARVESAEGVEVAKQNEIIMTNLAETADRITGIVAMINDIAEQTNLLALNATIEAARAGEAGRGFAVVAQEVKSLASQTGGAIADISTQVDEIGMAVSTTLDANAKIQKVIGSMSEMTSEINDTVGQQLAATAEITRNVQEAAQGTRSVSAEIDTVRASSESTAASAADVMDAAATMSDEASRLDQEVTEFVATALRA